MAGSQGYTVTRQEEEKISHALTDTEMRRLIGRFMSPPPILTKDQLRPITGTTIYLYQKDGPDTPGHWTLALFRGDEVEWFDSYGQNYGLSEVRSYLPSDKKLSRSSVRLQRFSPDVQDCGDYVVDRLKHRDMDYSSYIKMFRTSGHSPDVTVVDDVYNY